MSSPAHAFLLVSLASMVFLPACGGGGGKPPAKSDAPVEWEDYSSTSIGVSLKKPKDFTNVPGTPGTFTDNMGYITASYDKSTKSIDTLIAEEITRKQRDTQNNFKKRKLKDWEKSFKVVKKEKMKFGSHDGVELELSLAKEAKDNAPRTHKIEIWVKTADGLITIVWEVEEQKWEKYYEKYFKKSRESLKITK